MCHLACSCVTTEDQGLVKVDLSAILDPFDSKQFVVYVRLCHSFKHCALPSSPLFQSGDTTVSFPWKLFVPTQEDLVRDFMAVVQGWDC